MIPVFWLVIRLDCVWYQCQIILASLKTNKRQRTTLVYPNLCSTIVRLAFTGRPVEVQGIWAQGELIIFSSLCAYPIKYITLFIRIPWWCGHKLLLSLGITVKEYPE